MLAWRVTTSALAGPWLVGQHFVSSNGVLVHLLPQDGVMLEHRGLAAGAAAATDAMNVNARNTMPQDTPKPERRAIFIDLPPLWAADLAACNCSSSRARGAYRKRCHPNGEKNALRLPPSTWAVAALW